MKHYKASIRGTVKIKLRHSDKKMEGNSILSIAAWYKMLLNKLACVAKFGSGNTTKNDTIFIWKK